MRPNTEFESGGTSMQETVPAAGRGFFGDDVSKNEDAFPVFRFDSVLGGCVLAAIFSGEIASSDPG